MAKAQALQEAEKKAKQELEARKQRGRERVQRLNDPATLTQPKCWVCGRVGKFESEVFREVLVEKQHILLRKATAGKITLPPSMDEDNEAFREALLSVVEKGTLPLKIIPYEGNEAILDRIVMRDLACLLTMASYYCICQNCFNEHDELKLETLPKDWILTGIVLKPLVDEFIREGILKQAAKEN
jgi:hypothetical protein